MTTSAATPTVPPLLSDADLADHVVAALDAVLSSASVDMIGVSHWWDRATAALVSAAGAGSTWPRVVSTMCRKLQVGVLAERDARALDQLDAQLGDAQLGRWCYLAGRDAPYLVAMCRIRRADRAATRKTPKPPAPAAVADPTLEF